MGTTARSPPDNEFSFGKSKKNKRKGTAKLTVNVPGPGEVELAKTGKVEARYRTGRLAGSGQAAGEAEGQGEDEAGRERQDEGQGDRLLYARQRRQNTKTKRVKLVKR